MEEKEEKDKKEKRRRSKNKGINFKNTKIKNKALKNRVFSLPSLMRRRKCVKQLRQGREKMFFQVS